MNIRPTARLKYDEHLGSTVERYSLKYIQYVYSVSAVAVTALSISCRHVLQPLRPQKYVLSSSRLATFSVRHYGRALLCEIIFEGACNCQSRYYYTWKVIAGSYTKDEYGSNKLHAETLSIYGLVELPPALETCVDEKRTAVAIVDAAWTMPHEF